MTTEQFILLNTIFPMNRVIIYHLNKSHGHDTETACWTIITFHPLRQRLEFYCYFADESNDK